MRNFCIAHISPYSSLFVADHLCCVGVSFLDTQITGRMTPCLSFCPIQAPSPTWLASVVRYMVALQSTCLRQISSRKISFTALNEVMRSSVHSIGPLIKRQASSGADFLAKSAENSRLKFTAPRNRCIAFPSTGRCQLVIDFTFLGSMRMPSRVSR
jgi:hypothetical protein